MCVKLVSTHVFGDYGTYCLLSQHGYSAIRLTGLALDAVLIQSATGRRLSDARVRVTGLADFAHSDALRIYGLQFIES